MAITDVSDALRQSRAIGTKPADFDQFWADTFAATAAEPLSVEIEDAPLFSTPQTAVSRVFYRSLGGVRIMAWYVRPTTGGPFPLVLTYPGYSQSLGPQRFYADIGFAALNVAVRGHGWSDSDYRPGFPGLMLAGIENREGYAYQGVYADAWRAMDVALTLPEIDRERIYVRGGSQGGALTLLVAATRPEVKAAAPDVPFLCAIRNALALTNSYPYGEVNDYLRLHPERRDTTLHTLDSIDVIHFAPRITAPLLLSIGLRDDICPPETGFALINALTAPVEVETYPNAAHEGGGWVHGQRAMAWLKERAGL